MPATPDQAQEVIDALNGLNLNDQMACLTSLLFSYVVAACQQAGQIDQADIIVSNYIQSLPTQWQTARGMLLYGQLPN